MIYHSYQVNYFYIFIFIIFAVFLSGLIAFLPQIFAKNTDNKEKKSEYECGFEPLQKTIVRFDVKFYLVAILFLVFDIEIMFLAPWAVYIKQMSLFCFLSMMGFLFILTVGFVYEWKKGALDW